MFHRAIALEGNAEPLVTDSTSSGLFQRIRTLNYSPGYMDTPLHHVIRTEMPPTEFRKHQIHLKEQNKLVDPIESAKLLVSLLVSNDFENGSHLDYYDLAPKSATAMIEK